VRRGCEAVNVGDPPGASCDAAELAGQVADLAGRRRGGVADGGFAALGRVEVGAGGGAVAVNDRGGVDVVDCERGRVVSLGFQIVAEEVEVEVGSAVVKTYGRDLSCCRAGWRCGLERRCRCH